MVNDEAESDFNNILVAVVVSTQKVSDLLATVLGAI